MLKLSKHNLKATFRLASAHVEMQELDEADEVLKEVCFPLDSNLLDSPLPTFAKLAPIHGPTSAGRN